MKKEKLEKKKKKVIWWDIKRESDIWGNLPYLSQIGEA